MSLYLLDTDTWTLWRMKHPTIGQRAAAVKAPDVAATTIITVEEQLSGWYTRLRQARNRDEKARAYEHLRDAITAFYGWDIYSFTETAIIRFEHLLAGKLNVRKMDLAIAAIALEHSATVVTRNVRDFQRVPGLQVDDWSV